MGSCSSEQFLVEVERLFAAASQDRGAVDQLGRKLREYGLFEEYEDRFLAFF